MQWSSNHPPSRPVVFLSMRHMPCFWTDSLPFPRYWPLGLSFLYFQDNSNTWVILLLYSGHPAMIPQTGIVKNGQDHNVERRSRLLVTLCSQHASLKLPTLEYSKLCFWHKLGPGSSSSWGACSNNHCN
jgi:hypothetical protein